MNTKFFAIIAVFVTMAAIFVIDRPDTAYAGGPDNNPLPAHNGGEGSVDPCVAAGTCGQGDHGQGNPSCNAHASVNGEPDPCGGAPAPTETPAPTVVATEEPVVTTVTATATPVATETSEAQATQIPETGTEVNGTEEVSTAAVAAEANGSGTPVPTQEICTLFLGVDNATRKIVRVASNKTVTLTEELPGKYEQPAVLDCKKFVFMDADDKVFADTFGNTDAIVVVNADGTQLIGTLIASNGESLFAIVTLDGNVEVRDINMATGKPSFQPWVIDTDSPDAIAYCGQTVAIIEGGFVKTAAHNGLGEIKNWNVAADATRGINFDSSCSRLLYELDGQTYELTLATGVAIPVNEDGLFVEVDPHGSTKAYASNGEAILAAEFYGDSVVTHSEVFADLELDPNYFDWWKPR